MQIKKFFKQKVEKIISPFLFISNRVREIEYKIFALKKHADELSNENMYLKQKLSEYEPLVLQFEEWKLNPGLILKHFYPDMCIESLNFKLDQNGKLIKEEDNIFKELSKEDKMGHLRDIDLIHRSPAFNREIDKIVKDIQKSKILNNNEKEGQLLVLFLLFIAGMRLRFKAISTELQIELQPKKEHIRTHPLGSMAK
jgi:hypothetical protein